MREKEVWVLRRMPMKSCDMFEIVDALLKEPSCPSALRRKLDGALNAGSAGLEILGSIRTVLIEK